MADSNLGNEDTRKPGFRFGAAHPSTMNTGFADASVHSISYDIDPELLNMLAHRADGGTINMEDVK
jgi:hypothetical protein